MKQLNVVYIGQQPFPNGAATSKRRRYMVDYMNSHNISNHVLVTYYHSSDYDNPQQGRYDKTDYVNLNGYAAKMRFRAYYKEGKSYLKQWFSPKMKNIIIFPTVLNILDFPLYLFAKRLGYMVVFDQVETSYLKSGNLKFSTRCYYFANELLSKIAYKKSASFVISTALYNQNRKRYPSRPIAVLPNSSPVLCNRKKEHFNDTLTILYSGTYGNKEGVDYLIEGVLKALQQGCECRLVLLGKAPDALKERYKNQKRITFTGFVSDDELKSRLIDSDILAMVRTNSEFANYGFPFKLSEYLSTGNIVISTNVGDVSNYLKDKHNAYIIEPESSNAVCDAIVHINNNRNEALKVAENGFLTMNDKFSIESIGKIFVDFLNSL